MRQHVLRSAQSRSAVTVANNDGWDAGSIRLKSCKLAPLFEDYSCLKVLLDLHRYRGQITKPRHHDLRAQRVIRLLGKQTATVIHAMGD